MDGGGSSALSDQLMELTDILITTEEDVSRIFKIEGTNYEEIVRKLHEHFDFKVVAITLRENHGSGSITGQRLFCMKEESMRRPV